MATIDWPSGRAWMPVNARLGVQTPGTSWTPVYGGVRQQLSHLNDRLTQSFLLGPVRDDAQAARREALLLGLKSAGDWIRLHHVARPALNGTLSGAPTVTSNVLAGARALSLSGCAPGATLTGGDVLGVGGKLLLVYTDAVADGAGEMPVSLALPALAAISAGAVATLSKPLGTWELLGYAPQLVYEAGVIQLGLEISLQAV